MRPRDPGEEGRAASSLELFFAIWWAWMNFTWFGTSFDNDDWLYRVMTIVQMGGVLVLAAGIGPVFAEGDFTVAVLGYVLMRIVIAELSVRTPWHPHRGLAQGRPVHSRRGGGPLIRATGRDQWARPMKCFWSQGFRLVEPHPQWVSESPERR
nr:low temperature requirement protein A [Brevibacterium antiquum]